MTASHEPITGPDSRMRPVTMFGPDFPYAYDDLLAHPAGLGRLPAERHGTEVAVIGGGLSGIVAAYELMKMGLKPVVYEADRIGGRLRTSASRAATGIDRRAGRHALSRLRPPPFSTTSTWWAWRPAVPQPPGGGHAQRPSSTSRASRIYAEHARRSAAGLPGGGRRLARRPRRGRRLLRHAAGHPRARRRRGSGRSGRAGRRSSTTRPSTASSAGSDAFKPPSATARSSARSASAPAAGTPTSRTRSWRSCASSTPRPTTTTAASSAAPAAAAPALGARAAKMVHWPHGTSLASLHDGAPRPGRGPAAPQPAAASASPTAGATATSALRGGALHRPVLAAAPPRSPATTRSSRPTTGRPSSAPTTWSPPSSSCLVDRPFWLDRDPATGRDVMCMTLTDRMTRGTYLLDDGPDKPAVICLSYTWMRRRLKWLPLPANERVEVMLKSLGEDLSRASTSASTSSATRSPSPGRPSPNFMGAFKANLPGHYRYQRRLFTPLHAGRAAAEQARHLPRRRRHLLDAPAGPRAPCRPRSTRSGASCTTWAAPPTRPTRARATASPTWRPWPCPSERRRRPGPRAPGATSRRIARSSGRMDGGG